MIAKRSNKPSTRAAARAQEKVSQLLAERESNRPIWIRAPKVGYAETCQLTRSSLYSLAANGKIRTACIRQHGKARGIRLFHLPSILALIEAHTGDSKATDNQ